ncbi:hypothetical protein SAMN00790413_06034 [Deinococcus hopiensis KR-140]|uniref:Uncharacterized protein n=1 Tax=Deinococcus hopiensis KR-140 TaxID=695939 RepID=A0A1W1VVZ7_9DEIO|nr:hypothetical protein SAMN00790413_06034 [Deinococcus hopiensis KR-140]
MLYRPSGLLRALPGPMAPQLSRNAEITHGELRCFQSKQPGRPGRTPSGKSVRSGTARASRRVHESHPLHPQRERSAATHLGRAKDNVVGGFTAATVLHDHEFLQGGDVVTITWEREQN